MEKPLSFAEMLANPELMQEFQKGFAQGQALAETIKTSPTQPPVEGIEGAMNLSEPEMRKRMFQLMQKSMGQQESSIEQLRKSVAQEQERQAQAGALGRLDLRPFAQAMRQYGSSTVTVPAEAPVDRTEILRKLQDTLSKAEQGLTEDQVRAMRNLMEDRRNQQALLSQQNQEVRVFENIKRSFAKPQEDIAEFYQAHDAVKSALDSGDIAAIQSSLSNYARMSGEKGVLTDQDIARVMPDNLQQKAAVWWAKVASDPTTPAPEGVIEALKKGLGRLRSAAEDKAQARIDAAERQNLQGPGSYKTYAQSVAEQARKTIRTPSAPGGMSEAQKKRLEELKAKYGK